jgi:hypothetical protein
VRVCPKLPATASRKAQRKAVFGDQPSRSKKGRLVWAAFSVLIWSALRFRLGNTSLGLIHWIKPSGGAGPGYVSP